MQATVTLPPTWDTIDVVPLPEVARVAQVKSGDLYMAIHRGQLHPLPSMGKKVKFITKEEAVNFLMAVALAVTAGIAIATALRAVSAGATFPVPRG